MGNTQTKDRIESLTPKQLECLRLVADFNTSKEIARLLDISPSAVEQRLKNARIKLGVERSIDLVRLYQEYEKHLNPHYGQTTYGLSGVSIPHPLDNEGISIAERSPVIDDGEIDLLENQKIVAGSEQNLKRGFPSLSALLEVDRKNRLSFGERTAFMAMIAWRG